MLTPLYYFKYLLCAVVSSWDLGILVLFQYDILARRMHQLVLKNLNIAHHLNSVICTSSSRLYLISEVENEQNVSSIRVTMFERSKITEGLKICAEKSLSFDTAGEPGYMININVSFSHFYDQKLYIFYRLTGNGEYLTNTLDDVRILTVCSKSLRVLKDRKLAEEDVRL